MKINVNYVSKARAREKLLIMDHFKSWCTHLVCNVRLTSSWPEVEGDELHSSCCMHLQFKCLNNYAESFKEITSAVFLFQVIEMQVSTVWENAQHRPSRSETGMLLWTSLTAVICTCFGPRRLLLTRKDEEGAQWSPSRQWWWHNFGCGLLF